jgi:hypothetical protein
MIRLKANMSLNLNAKPQRHVGNGVINSRVLTSVVDGGESLVSLPCRFTPEIL